MTNQLRSTTVLEVPNLTPIAWHQVAPGDTIVGRDGRRVLIRARPSPLHITTIDGTFTIDPKAATLRVDATEDEALVAIIIAFPGVTRVES